MDWPELARNGPGLLAPEACCMIPPPCPDSVFGDFYLEPAGHRITVDYKLRPIGKNCAATGEPLEPGSVCYSVVVEKQGQFVREDYSDKAWQGPPENALGFWQSVVPAAEKNKTRSLDSEALMQYFEQLSEDGNEAAGKNRYVIALLLLQKRRMIVEGSRRDGDEEFLICSGKQGEGPFEIKNFALPDEEVRLLQDQLRTSLAAA